MFASDNIERDRAAYARPPSTTARRVEEMVLGRDVGLGGYTTVEQATLLTNHLALPRGAWVLDIGTGRGWPASHVAARLECKLVATDVPVEALHAAKSYLEIGREPSRAQLAAADGTALPFRPSIFAAVIHADVFC
jgi:ubiquinone/menaquinone biosynthesis C-methylase UbiE